LVSSSSQDGVEICQWSGVSFITGSVDKDVAVLAGIKPYQLGDPWQDMFYVDWVMYGIAALAGNTNLDGYTVLLLQPRSTAIAGSRIGCGCFGTQNIWSEVAVLDAISVVERAA
jgi:hypothetical protein